MHFSRLLRIVLIVLPVLITFALAPLLAQTGARVPRRLSSDGHSTPLRWEAAGIIVARPGAPVSDRGQSRIATELWRIDPTNGDARQLAADAPQSGGAQASANAGVRIYVVNPDTLEPEVWLAAADGSNPRLLLRGQSEYFMSPTLAPDGKHFLFVRTPTGSETHGTSAIWMGDANGANLRLFIGEAAAPVWSPDSSQAAFEHRGDLYVLDADAAPPHWDERLPSPAPSAPAAPGALTPPATISVYHTQSNANYSNCTPMTVSVGTIRVLPFETYVSWVVPTEMSALSPIERLKVQAVAARTYAWYKILTRPAGQAYDVTDWTDNQAMCELRAHPNSDAATQATAGQYIAYNNAVIIAMYGAEGSDPTKTNYYQLHGGSYPYLLAVDDPVGFGQTRYGHGQGMSQLGALRWARDYGWNYLQILTHYYSGVTIDGPGTFGSLEAPWQRWWQTSNRARIAATGNNNAQFGVWAQGAGLTLTQVSGATRLTSLNLSSAPDQAMGSLIISGTLSGTPVTTLTLGLDRQPPTGTLTLPAVTLIPTVTVMLGGTDAGPSGYAGYGLSHGWRWEGEEKAAQGYVLGAGTVVSDAAALNGQALFAAANTGIADWYGPYDKNLPLGYPYRVYFRLKASNNLTTSEVAKIDVAADGLNPIGIKHLYGTDFRAANTYQEFYTDLDFTPKPEISEAVGVEFRVRTFGKSDLWLDRVLVATYPVTTPGTVTWMLGGAPGALHTVVAKFSDRAGNVSEDVPGAVYYGWASRLYLPAVVR